MSANEDKKSRVQVLIGDMQITYRFMRYAIKNIKVFKASRATSNAKVLFTRINMMLGKMKYDDPLFHQRLAEFNQAYIELHKAKWYGSLAALKKQHTMVNFKNTETSKECWKKHSFYLKRAKKLSQQVFEALESGDTAFIPMEKAAITNNGTEIKFADGIPLVPEINPVVILEGSEYDMGYQYAQQIVAIFGSWIFEIKAGRSKELTTEEREILMTWEEQVKQYTPELIPFIQGWAAGATDAGTSMSYEDVLDIWVGHKAPLNSMMGMDTGEIAMPYTLMGCSGVAAWGKATRDGKLVTASTGDHDNFYNATMVCFPETGNNYIYQPFSATGDIGKAGPLWMFGHPGMNNKGLAYVQHGGGPKMIEPVKYWGTYGVKRSASVLHILRFAGSAREAKKIELSQPLSDIGAGDMGHPGGFWADSEYGYIIESRKDPILIREPGLLGETDFCYANNGAVHPEAYKASWMVNPSDWKWEKKGGWYPRSTAKYRPFLQSLTQTLAEGMKVVYFMNYGRGERHFNMMERGFGKIDFDYMKMVYRYGGKLKQGSWKEISKDYNRTGNWGEISPAHSTNAINTITRPDDGDNGIWAGLAGPAKRDLVPLAPLQSAPIYNETNAFWEIKLAANPAGVREHAKLKADEYIKDATHEVRQAEKSSPAYQPLQAFLKTAEREFEQGDKFTEEAKKAQGNEAVYNWAAATRAYTRAQVNALQAYQALVPPPSKPGDLGF